MLAFNLGVFFRNLKGEEVTFSAKNDLCEVRFTGGVVSLHEHTDLTRHLSVTLGKGDLSFRIAFDENEEQEEEPDDTAVEVRLVQEGGERETLLLQSSFRFSEISLKPVSDGEEPEGDGAAPEDEPTPA
ncbi:MAG: hypothetical protein IIA41_12375 [SAR324 cluster bacterium]|nr:hypothetical protein [SAR324 cluster bacterium]